MTKSSHSRLLSKESQKEFGTLVLLDQLMRYDLLYREKEYLQEIIIKLEEEVANLKQGFFRTEEQDQELNFQKDQLSEAKDAFLEVEKEMLGSEKFRINIALAEKDEEGLEPFLKFMEERNVLMVGDDNFYQPTKKGRKLYDQLVEQLESYVFHFEVFSHVNLDEGSFGDPNRDLLEGDQWFDLRVAVAEYKGIDPFRVVFLAMMSEEGFCENPDWKFDLSLGTLFNELEHIVQAQISINDLSYRDEEGIVSGEDVLRDIIAQGKILVYERNKMKMEKNEKSQPQELPDEQTITNNYNW